MDGVGETAALLTKYDEVMAGWADPDADYEKLGAQQAELEAKIEAVGAWDLQRTIEIAMDAPPAPGDAEVSTCPAVSAAGGPSRLLLSHPDLLLPRRAHQPPRRRAGGLARAHPCRTTSGTVVAITHDRYFLDNVAGWIPELDRGRATRSRATTAPGSSRSERLSQEEKAGLGFSARTLDRELEGAHGPKAARPRARPASPPTRSCSPRPAAEGRVNELEIHIPPASASATWSSRPTTCRRASATSSDRRPVVQPAAGGIVGVIGPNGAGKTTLFRMIMGRRSRGAPHRTSGRSADRRAGLRRPVPTPSATPTTVYEEITAATRSPSAAGWRPAYVASFNFRAATSRRRSAMLSGGERNRVHLALLRRGGNVLLLDEPTNDLDVDTLRALEGGLESFPAAR